MGRLKQRDFKSHAVFAALQLAALCRAIQFYAVSVENAYALSCIPWVSFRSFSVHSYENKPYYFPSVETGKIYASGERLLLPLSITCHHAAADGYHVKRFLDILQDGIDHMITSY